MTSMSTTEVARISRTDFAQGRGVTPIYNSDEIELWRERGYIIVTREVTDWTVA